jgi:hypothetical protein
MQRARCSLFPIIVKKETLLFGFAPRVWIPCAPQSIPGEKQTEEGNNAQLFRDFHGTARLFSTHQTLLNMLRSATWIALTATALFALISTGGADAATATLLDVGINYDQLDWPRVRLTLETPGGGPINGAAGGSFPDTTAPAGAAVGTYLDIPAFLDVVATELGGGNAENILPQILYREDLIVYDSTTKRTTIALVFGEAANDPTTTTTTPRRLGTTTTAAATNFTVTSASYEGGNLARQLRQLLLTNGISTLTPYVTYKAVFGDTPTYAPTTTYLETFTPVPTFNISEIGANGTLFEESSSSVVAMAVGITLGVIVLFVIIGVGYTAYQSYKTKGMLSGKKPVGNAAKYATSEV